MSHTTNSAARSAQSLFSVVTVTAESIGHGVKAIGNCAEVANVHSNEWLAKVKLKAVLIAEDRDAQALDEVANSMATRTVERLKVLAQSEPMRLAYDESYTKLQAVLAASRGQDQSQAIAA